MKGDLMKKALLISGLLVAASVPVSRADEVTQEEPKKEIEITAEDVKQVEAFVEMVQNAIEDASQEESKEAA